MKIGIIICDRYKGCAGGKCFRAMQNREGAFDRYQPEESLDIAGYTSCGGCPGGNIEYATEEMMKNGAQAIHLATGFVVGYPPCPHITYFKEFIEDKCQVRVVMGPPPTREKYLETHTRLNTWSGPQWPDIVAPTMSDETVRKAYN